MIISINEIIISPLEKRMINIKNILKRSFPIYKKSDENAAPKGGTRVLDYKLVARW